MPYKDPERARQSARKRQRKYRAQPWVKAHMARYSKEYQARVGPVAKAFIRGLKRDKPCVDCGIVYPHMCMDFHHVRGHKIYNVSQMVSGQSKATIRKEAAKCELVCANCHRIRHYPNFIELDEATVSKKIKPYMKISAPGEKEDEE